MEFTSYGLYRPHYDFGTSERYKTELEGVRKQQKELIKSKQAAVCHTEWSVSSSRTEGRKMEGQYTRLMLRAFNGECDATVLKARWNNLTKLEERIKKTHKAIDKFGTVMNMEITRKYLRLKISW